MEETEEETVRRLFDSRKDKELETLRKANEEIRVLLKRSAEQLHTTKEAMA